MRTRGRVGTDETEGRRTTRVALAALFVAGAFVVPTAGPVDAQVGGVPPGTQTPLANPPISDSCGTNVTLVLDASGSISSSNAVGDVRDAGEAFLDALADTGSTARVLQFASVSEELAPQVEVTQQSLAPSGVLRDAINGYYNPKPPRPNSVQIHRYDGRGNPQSSSNWNSRNGDNQYTNWDQSLDQAGEAQALPTELILYVTDGDPTAYDFNQAGDPFDAGPPPDVGTNTNRDQARATTLDRAVQEANQAKAGGARILAVGVGSAVTGPPASVARLVDISGRQVVDDGDLDSITSINDVDVALVRDFDKLAQFLRGVVSELCSPSLSIRKLAQTPGDADYLPAPGWEITVDPTVDAGGTYEWILPDTDAAQAALCGNPADPNDQAVRTCLTNTTGLANFQWEPDPADAQTSAIVTEQLLPGYTAGRPGVDDDWACTLKNIDGTEERLEGDFTSLTPPTFGLDVDAQQIITCNIYNSFDYVPAIAVAKRNDPVVVRGDLTPTYGPGPATLTSRYTVDNVGNAPLVAVGVDDDLCSPVVPTETGGINDGDTNGDGRLDVTEQWLFECTRSITRGITTSPINIVNTALAQGTDPSGQRVESAPVTDDVDVIVPDIDIVKTVSSGTQGPADEISVFASPPGTPVPVTYSYAMTSDGNTRLDVTDPTDDTCAPVTPDLQAPPDATLNAGDADRDGFLDAGETWTYRCSTTVSTDTVNTATVSGTPSPESLPTPNPNPPVTATDTARVNVISAAIELRKTVDQSVVFPGTLVNYTYEVENNGVSALVPDGLNPPAASGDPATEGLTITDDRCASVSYVTDQPGGDGDAFLDPGEAWTYTCTATIFVDTLNTATVIGQPDGFSTSLTDTDTALVVVREGDIAVTKRALRPVVLDPNASPESGPDVPTPRRAQYSYQVSNPGSLPLDLTDGTNAALRIGDDVCPAVDPVLLGGFNIGDANADDLVDVDEVWLFRCEQALDKSDGVVPPGPDPLPADVTNTVTVTGTPLLDNGGVPERGPAVVAVATADVLVIEPELTLIKTPCLDLALTTCVDDPLVRPGTDITYRYEIENTGDTGIELVDGSDDRCATYEFVGGDTNGNDLIDGGTGAETWVFRCTTTVAFPSPVVNTAIVVGVGPLGNVYTATDTAQVRLFEPAINLVKSVSADFVPAGSQVTYTFEVTNAGIAGAQEIPGDLVLSDLILVDVSEPANPGCLSPTFTGGDGNGNDLLDLDPPETWTYRCTGVITEQTVDVAGVEGTDILGGLVFDFDGAIVTPYSPGIAITKVADPVELPLGGGPVTYSYEVTNTGDVPLADVDGRVSDDKCAPVQPVLDAGFNIGDVDRNGLLTGDADIFETGGPETWLFSCSTTLAQTTVNVVTTAGTPVRPNGGAQTVLGPDVTAQATAEVRVPVPGEITIIKVADPAGPTSFSFTGDLGGFNLVDNDSSSDRRTFAGVSPGVYRVTEGPVPNWSLVSITCVDPTNNTLIDLTSSTATIDVGDGESITCTFTNRGGGELPATGSSAPARLMLLGLLLVIGGLTLMGARSRRRPA